MLVRIGFITIVLLFAVSALAGAIDDRNTLIGTVTDSPDNGKSLWGHGKSLWGQT